MDALFTIQQELNAPKGQYNSFGKYKYRSCEDILAAVKPLLCKTNSTLNLSDELVQVGSRIYVKATATLTTEDGKTHSATAFAREDETKKGMDGAQVTGSASSYARKYALNGLFSIDDTKDPDATNTHGQDADGNDSRESRKAATPISQVAYTGEQLTQAIGEMNACTTEAQFQQVWSKYATSIPALCKNGTEFYNAACAKIQQLKPSK